MAMVLVIILCVYVVSTFINIVWYHERYLAGLTGIPFRIFSICYLIFILAIILFIVVKLLTLVL